MRIGTTYETAACAAPEIVIKQRWYDNLKRGAGRAALAGALVMPLSACTLTATSPEPDGSTQIAEITVAEWNTLYTNSPKNIARCAAQFAAGNPSINTNNGGADIIAFQETHHKAQRDAIKEKLSEEYGSYISNRAPDLPIFWKKTVSEQVGEGQDIQVHDTLQLNDGGSGGDVISDRHIVWVELNHIATGTHYVAANSHVLPDNQLESREEYFKMHIAALKKFVAEMKERGLPVIMTMDANVNFRKAEYQALFEETGLEIVWVELGFPNSGTHGENRVIDGTLDADSEAIRLQPVFVTKWPDRCGADHYATLAIYSFNLFGDQSSTPSPSEATNEDDTVSVPQTTAYQSEYKTAA